ncbi:hypothetical protein [Pseudodonghicola flavimaris]|uniref:Uncharacterized protein n=1 Tax=Pseudodonghicola flavimaris TaxID=3050036 RepID=A0ABT7EVZ0_9RHOB|nr:hypothetical protein [Pseudodonghicola flavimaris]MDK3016513.1 hypothetical protein [Pseudodonghicola flavimaris]
MAIYHTDITLCPSDGGELPDVPVTVDYDARWQPAEPDVGIFTGYPEVEGLEITTVQIGGWKAGRVELVEMCGEEEVDRQEELIAERITEDLMTGEMEAA